MVRTYVTKIEATATKLLQFLIDDARDLEAMFTKMQDYIAEIRQQRQWGKRRCRYGTLRKPVGATVNIYFLTIAT